LNSEAQWVQVSNGMGTNKIVRSITAIGDNIFAATTDSGVYKSTNNGALWTHTSLNNPDTWVIATNGNNIFAACGYTGIFASSNMGLNWSLVFPYSSVRIYSLLAIGNTIFAGTDGYGVYISTNNGNNWSHTSFIDRSIWSLAIKDNIVIAGAMQAPVGPRGGVFTTTNNGINWFQTSLYDVYLYSVGVCGNNIYAGVNTGSFGLYRSTNNGNNWMQTSLINVQINCFTSSGTNILAGGDNFYVSSNNGTNWIQKGENLPYTGIYCLQIANNYIYAGTTNGYSVWRRPLSEIIGIQNISTEIPAKYSLGQNYPNPFNPRTVIRCQLPVVSNVLLKVYDVMGREVQTLVNERLQPGTYETSFDGSMLNSGVYFYKLKTDGFTETKKMLLIK
jgi:photosystem II stability/assembly factor-like uncharacterized protein